MSERLSQEVAAAGQEARGEKRELETTAALTASDQTATSTTTDAASTDAATSESTTESATKRARFDNNSTKDNGKKKWERRDRRGTGRAQDSSSSSSATRSANADENESTSDRLPKRKVAVKFGYCGIGYSGLQINPGVKTIEGDIFDAFCTAGAVSADNAVNPNKVGLQRAARTDRGVHAAGNLLSLKLILEPPSLQSGETLVDKVNSLLPDFIRIWGITRVQNGFNARQSCDSRMYEYLLPTYVFIPPKPESTMYTMLEKMRDEELVKLKESQPDASEEELKKSSSLHPILHHPFWEEHGTQHDFSADIAAKKKFRLSSASLDRIRSIFKRYLGSHNFYNFTVGKEFRDRSCQRFMKALTISEPKMIQDVEWVSIKFHGQSFMLHQIRKMIGLLVLVGRTGAGEGLVEECFGPARVHIPKAPGLGLLLERPIFDAYNSRIRNNNDKIRKLIRKKSASSSSSSSSREEPPAPTTTPAQPQSEGQGQGQGQGEDQDQQGDAGKASSLEDELRDIITYDPHTATMETFKQQWIYDRIIATEQETNEFGKWLNYLDVFQGPDFQFLNPKGVIPAQAIVKVGEFHRDQLRKPTNNNINNGAQGGGNNGAAVDLDLHNDNEDDEEDDEDREAYGKKGRELDEYEG